jgi:hypothetical protein
LTWFIFLKHASLSDWMNTVVVSCPCRSYCVSEILMCVSCHEATVSQKCLRVPFVCLLLLGLTILAIISLWRFKSWKNVLRLL